MNYLWLGIIVVSAIIALRGIHLLVLREFKPALKNVAVGLVVGLLGCGGALYSWLDGWHNYTAEPNSEIAQSKFRAAFDLGDVPPPGMEQVPHAAYGIPPSITNIRYGTMGFQEYVSFLRFNFKSEDALVPLLAGWTAGTSLNIDTESPEWWLEKLTSDMKLYTRTQGSGPGSITWVLIVDGKNHVAYWAEEYYD